MSAEKPPAKYQADPTRSQPVGRNRHERGALADLERRVAYLDMLVSEGRRSDGSLGRMRAEAAAIRWALGRIADAERYEAAADGSEYAHTHPDGPPHTHPYVTGIGHALTPYHEFEIGDDGTTRLDGRTWAVFWPLGPGEGTAIAPCLTEAEARAVAAQHDGAVVRWRVGTGTWEDA